MKKHYILTLVLACFLTNPIFADGGPSYQFPWEEIMTVKGGFKEALIEVPVEAYEMTLKYRAVFDDKGRLIRYTSEWDVRDFKYDAQGRVQEIVYSFLEEGKEILDSKVLYHYDGSGLLKGTTDVDKNGKLTPSPNKFAPDGKGNVVETNLTPDGEIAATSTYSKNLTLVERAHYSSKDEKGKQEAYDRWTYTYDAQGLLKRIERVFTDENNKPEKSQINFAYQMDKNGNRVLETQTVTPADAYFDPPANPKVTFKYNMKVTAPVTAQPTASPFPVNTKIRILYEGTFYPGVVLKVDGERFFVHYDEYDASWDEWVTAERIQKP